MPGSVPKTLYISCLSCHKILYITTPYEIQKSEVACPRSLNSKWKSWDMHTGVWRKAHELSDCTTLHGGKVCFVFFLISFPHFALIHGGKKSKVRYNLLHSTPTLPRHSCITGFKRIIKYSFYPLKGRFQKCYLGQEFNVLPTAQSTEPKKSHLS